MKQLKRNLLFLAVAVLLVGVSSAFAQVQFQASSNVRNVRLEGTTEAVGTVTLAAITGGNIDPLSSISLDFGTEVLSTGTVTCGAATCTIVTTGSSGNILLLDFTTAAAVFMAGQTIDIVGVRVDANAFGVGTINASLSATVPAGSPAITFFIVLNVPVAEVQAQATTVDISAADPLLTCSLGPEGFSITITENFNQALTSAADEDGFGDVSPAAEFGVIVEIEFKDVPLEMTIEFDAFGADQSGTLAVTPSPAIGATQVSKTGAQDLTWTFLVTGSSTTGVNEVLDLDFIADDLGAGIGLGAFTGTATVSLTSGADDTTDEVPLFATNVQGTDDVVSTLDCNTYLLFSWLPNTGDGLFDSGVAISNTTADPAIIGTTGQTGSVTMYFWATDGTIPAASPVTLSTALGPGETVTGVVSTMLGQPFLGYSIAVLGFQLGHGFAFVNNPAPGTGGAFAQGYLPLSITSPRLPATGTTAVTESRGH